MAELSCHLQDILLGSSPVTHVISVECAGVGVGESTGT